MLLSKEDSTVIESATTPPMPFVGRKAELDQLNHHVRAVIGTRRPAFVLVQGDFGVGKTLLVEHFLNQLSDGTPSVLIGRGKCAMETEINGLAPFNQLFVDLAEQGIQRRVVLGSVLQFTKEVAPAWLDLFTLGAASAMSKTVEHGSKLISQSTFSQENVFEQFANAIARLAEKQPVIGFIDDLHWADASSLRLLFHMVRHLNNRPVLFICTYRPVEAMETGSNASLFREIRADLIRSGALELELGEGINVDDYVAQRYPVNTYPPEFTAQVQRQTGGHALFVSQLFSLWQENDVIISTPDPKGQPVWRLKPGIQVSATIPRTLSEVLNKRMRLMKEQLCDMLDYAAVEGEDFTVQVVTHLLRLDEYRAYDDLETLEDRYYLVREQETKDLETRTLDFYRFTHRFFREHIYNQLSAGKRRIVHRQIAEYLETLYSDHYEIAGSLALHFREAHVPLKAAGYAVMAAQFEQSRYAWPEGERWCELGLSLLDKVPESDQAKQLRFDLLDQSGHGCWISGRHAQAEQRYTEALALAARIEVEPQRIALLSYRLADSFSAEDRPAEALEILAQGRQVLVEHDVPLSETHLYIDMLTGHIQLHYGRYAQGAQMLEKVLETAAQLEQTRAVEEATALTYHYLAVMLSRLSRYSEAHVAYHKAIQLADKLDWKRVVGFASIDLAEDLIGHNELADAEVQVLRAMEIARQVSDLGLEAFARYMDGFLLLNRGKPQEAEEQLTQSLMLCREISALWNVPRIHAELARAKLALSDIQGAYQYATMALDLAQKSLQDNSSSFTLAYALSVLAQVEVAMQEPERAIEHLREAVTMFEEVGNPHFLARTRFQLAGALLQRNDKQDAVALLGSALDAFQALGLPKESAETQLLLEAALKPRKQ